MSTPRQVLQGAINVVFGMPFLYGLLVAVRGRGLWASHRVFGDVMGRNTALLWLIVATTGMLWLGTSLAFTSSRAGRITGTCLIVAGFGLSLACRP